MGPRAGLDHTSSEQDLLKHTPPSHVDHLLLLDALRISQNFLSSINEEITPRRHSMMVKKGEVRPRAESGLLPDRKCSCCLIVASAEVLLTLAWWL